jgi:hypothetical protein
MSRARPACTLIQIASWVALLAVTAVMVQRTRRRRAHHALAGAGAEEAPAMKIPPPTTSHTTTDRPRLRDVDDQVPPADPVHRPGATERSAFDTPEGWPPLMWALPTCTSTEVEGPARSSTSTSNDPAIGYHLRTALARIAGCHDRRSMFGVWRRAKRGRPAT